MVVHLAPQMQPYANVVRVINFRIIIIINSRKLEFYNIV